MNPSFKTSSHKSGILALIGLAALAWIKLDRNGSADTLAATGTHEMDCSSLHRCVTNLNASYPVGDGLVFTPIMDDFF